jgi:hypothetical protein
MTSLCSGWRGFGFRSGCFAWSGGYNLGLAGLGQAQLLVFQAALFEEAGDRFGGNGTDIEPVLAAIDLGERESIAFRR